MARHILSGVYAAALTPLQQNFAPDVEAIPPLLRFFARRGCHGALLLGTTGEGPSFDSHERLEILRAGLQIRQEIPDFRLLAGTGTPSLTETIHLTRTAFDLGYDGAVVLPPYYYHQATIEGLFTWFQEVIQRAVPSDGYLLGYHIPPQSRVPLSLDLLVKLKDQFPDQFAGIKDSSSDPQFSQTVGNRFGSSLVVLIGSDALFSHGLANHASGCITALANLFSPELRMVWDAYQRGETAPETQTRLNNLRSIMSKYTPYPPSLKALIAQLHGFPQWSVRPPLQPFPEEATQQAISEIDKA